MIAHINESTKEKQTVKEHCENTAKLCKEFSIEPLKNVLYTIGLLHDIGKYQKSFQEKIVSGKNIQVEHSTCGAKAAITKYPNAVGYLMAYCIAGHHTGIPDGGVKSHSASDISLAGRLQRTFEDFSVYQEELQIPEIDINEVFRFILLDCEKNRKDMLISKFAFFTRYCFSCLTDADSLDTAEFCRDENIKTVLPLVSDFGLCLDKLNEKLQSFQCETELQKTRSLLQKQVFDKSEMDAEIYLMNMPTGSGKTLCSMKFALERAIRGNKKRIIYIIPYNSIIDQTVTEFEKNFGKDAQILRHQSTFSYDKEDMSEDYKLSLKIAAENWDVSSIIVTTAVQFFESIYANKRRKLRKLHNMADSILIFDEAHLMPEDYLQPCLQAIAYITKYLNSEAVFLTATMPNFHSLLQEYALKNSKILELVDDRSMFSAFKKCRFRNIGEQTEENILTMAREYPSSLIIVNEKKTARLLYSKCTGRKYHLSTYMILKDRQRILNEIKEELLKLEKEFPDGNVPEDKRITIISTSLIEAGVDLDAHVVFRELSGMDSILQAGGRCNREGKRKGASVFVFHFSENRGRIGNRKKEITKGILERYEDISSQEAIEEYYTRFYAMNTEKIKSNTITNDSYRIESIHFREYAENFHIIDSKNVSIVVAIDDTSKTLLDMVKFGNVDLDTIRALQSYICNVNPKELEELVKQGVVKEAECGIWYLDNTDYYNSDIGIIFEGKDYFV